MSRVRPSASSFLAARAKALPVSSVWQISSFVAKGLRSAGFGTHVVDSGTDAAVEASSATYDLLILDLGLPGKDGMEVLRELRGRGEQLPVV